MTSPKRHIPLDRKIYEIKRHNECVFGAVLFSLLNTKNEMMTLKGFFNILEKKLLQVGAEL